MIKRGYVTEGRRNSRDLNYLILALFTKARETGDITINSKNKNEVSGYPRNPLHKSLQGLMLKPS